MTVCKWCNRPLEGEGVAACKGRRACACRQAYEEGEEQGRAEERAEVERLRRALAAGPAALRLWGDIYGNTAAIEVERAQADAMKEEP